MSFSPSEGFIWVLKLSAVCTGRHTGHTVWRENNSERKYFFSSSFSYPRYETSRGRQLVNTHTQSLVLRTQYTIHTRQLAWISLSNYLTEGMFIQSVRGGGEREREREITHYNYHKKTTIIQLYSKLHYCSHQQICYLHTVALTSDFNFNSVC